jgi:hypothetical protein
VHIFRVQSNINGTDNNCSVSKFIFSSNQSIHFRPTDHAGKRQSTHQDKTMKTNSTLRFLLPSLVTGLSAFETAGFSTAPSSIGRRNSRNSPSGALDATSPFVDDFGATAPHGYWDPIGLTTDGDRENFDHLREVELRHGRVSMLAISGWLVTAAGARLPGMQDTPFGFKAIYELDGLLWEVRGTLPLTLGSVWFLTFFMADLEGTAEFPGDYRNGVVDFGWDMQSDEWKRSKRAIELNNGRGAMIGILGIMVHEQLGNLTDIGLPQP